jgi:hypothetical protein
MIKLIDILKEIADSPYTLSAPTKSQRGKFDFFVDYYFTTDNKREYYVRFSSDWKGRSKQPNQKYNWATELTFFPKENRSVGEPLNVGNENFGKILATISKSLLIGILRYISSQYQFLPSGGIAGSGRILFPSEINLLTESL